MSGEQDAFNFIQGLWRESSAEGQLGLWSLPGSKSEWYPPTATGFRHLATRGVKLGRKKNVYFRITSAIPPKDKRLRGGSGQSVGLPALFADMDVREWKKERLGNKLVAHYPTEAEVRKLLSEVELKPSAIIRSGGGIHTYWFLSSPVPALDNEDIPGLWQDYLRRHLNGKLDSTADLARVLRLPGTLNHNYPNPRGVAIERLDPDCRYAITDFLTVIRTIKGEPASPDDGQTDGTILIPQGSRHDSIRKSIYGYAVDTPFSFLLLWKRSYGMVRSCVAPSTEDPITVQELFDLCLGAWNKTRNRTTSPHLSRTPALKMLRGRQENEDIGFAALSSPLPSLHLNISTPQHHNISTPQHHNISTPQHLSYKEAEEGYHA